MNYQKDDDENFNKTVEKQETETHVIETITWKSLDGTQTYQKVVSKSKAKEMTESLDELKAKLELAVSKEDYETAITLRDKIKKLEAKNE
jgi:protein-arginine kinase activator protein McsA